ncbi:MAG: diphosphomevalonate decarboxylase [Saprospiraceae bacterium]
MVDYKNPQLIIESSKTNEGEITWRSPSNIAIIKYWGKYGRQLPKNPSISFTLNEAFSETTVKYAPKNNVDQGIEVDFYFEGQPNEAFRAKIVKFLDGIIDIFPFLRQLKFEIHSRNSFPHSAGIASSASAMSALSLCLCTIEHEIFGTLPNDKDYEQKASYIARLGSGSACRSIYAQAAIWGESGEVEGSSNLYAIPYAEQMHEVFSTFHDDILIVSKAEKSVSSRAGHALMDGNLYADNRYLQARQRFHNLLSILKKGDVEAFGRIAESEALTLHALMMTSNPPYLLMRPNTLQIIEKVQQFRKDTQQPLYFTLDAGPNIHLLYPDESKIAVQSFIHNELKQYCEDGTVLSDFVGEGPVQV